LPHHSQQKKQSPVARPRHAGHGGREVRRQPWIPSCPEVTVVPPACSPTRMRPEARGLAPRLQSPPAGRHQGRVPLRATNPAAEGQGWSRVVPRRQRVPEESHAPPHLDASPAIVPWDLSREGGWQQQWIGGVGVSIDRRWWGTCMASGTGKRPERGVGVAVIGAAQQPWPLSASPGWRGEDGRTDRKQRSDSTCSAIR
jgi:hypothetical protein